MVGMDSFVMLNEEVFKHLCSLAIDKVSDKTERRKAGCGGVAMRKRFVKNVSFLYRGYRFLNGSDGIYYTLAEDETLRTSHASHFLP